jgi:hypothetical protein
VSKGKEEGTNEGTFYRLSCSEIMWMSCVSLSEYRQVQNERLSCGVDTANELSMSVVNIYIAFGVQFRSCFFLAGIDVDELAEKFLKSARGWQDWHGASGREAAVGFGR